MGGKKRNSYTCELPIDLRNNKLYFMLSTFLQNWFFFFFFCTAQVGLFQMCWIKLARLKSSWSFNSKWTKIQTDQLGTFLVLMKSRPTTKQQIVKFCDNIIHLFKIENVEQYKLLSCIVCFVFGLGSVVFASLILLTFFIVNLNFTGPLWGANFRNFPFL